MNPSTCPKCGHPTAPDAATCPDCGQLLSNGAAPLPARPLAPPEARNWIIYPTPPEVLARARQTFSEEEFLAGLREIEETGGLQFEDFVEDLERAAGEHE
jgi:hypothetical protein